MKSRLAALCLLPALALSETTDEPAPPSKSVLQTALSWMQSSDPDRRHAAYRSVHLIGEEALPGFKQALQAAAKFHEHRLGDLLSGKSGDGNPYRELGAILEELQTERERVHALLLIDYHKEPTKIRMLRDEMEALTRLYERAVKHSSADPTALDREVDGVALALVEIHAELKRFEELSYGEAGKEDQRPIEEQKLAALKDTFQGDTYLRDKSRFTKFRSECDALALAESDNKNCSWANSSQRDFATLLNHERAATGLPALRLEEDLSRAATDHSKDMISVGFFAHNSPVKGKASPSDRARMAGFKSRWTGENIFMGSPSHSAAYSAWFGSDGHRFIMFAKGPNLLGLGPVGKHWTLMTGRR
ncbi:MAG: CAP domain-containing protein [Verrucomicrobia bacterium]|nr:CAP domain-containing protein [Verrucomicrobiota bacterium]MDA1006748.1 CAP domain-containing protein [Verrucomicrobiota bacterium]